MDYSVPHRLESVEPADLRQARRELQSAVWRAESALAELAQCTNKVRALLGWPPIDPFIPFPEAVAQDAEAARAGWRALDARGFGPGAEACEGREHETGP